MKYPSRKWLKVEKVTYTSDTDNLPKIVSLHEPVLYSTLTLLPPWAEVVIIILCIPIVPDLGAIYPQLGNGAFSFW